MVHKLPETAQKMSDLPPYSESSGSSESSESSESPESTLYNKWLAKIEKNKQANKDLYSKGMENVVNDISSCIERKVDNQNVEKLPMVTFGTSSYRDVVLKRELFLYIRDHQDAFKEMIDKRFGSNVTIKETRMDH